MLIRIIILFVLIGINGILSSSEIAFLSLNKYNLSRKKDKKAKNILKILEDESSLKGNLTAVNVVSNAKSEGQILASGTVELQNLAYVHGDIAAATFSVTSGAKIKGTVTINE